MATGREVSSIISIVMIQDELYRLAPDRCIVMIKGQKPFLDYKINSVSIEPVEPEVRPLQEVLRPDEAEYYDP